MDGQILPASVANDGDPPPGRVAKQFQRALAAGMLFDRYAVDGNDQVSWPQTELLERLYVPPRGHSECAEPASDVQFLILQCIAEQARC